MLLLAVVLAAALALRLLHLYAVSQTVFVDFHRVFTASDMHGTWQWAKQTDVKVFTTLLAFQWCW